MSTTKNTTKNTDKNTTKEPKVKQATKMNKRTMNALVTVRESFDATTAQGRRKVAEAQWASFDATVSAHTTLHAKFTADSILKNLPKNEAPTWGNVKASFSDADSGNYLAPEDRKLVLPSDSVLSRSWQLAAMHTAERREAYAETHAKADGKGTEQNAPKVQEYVAYLTVVEGVAKTGEPGKGGLDTATMATEQGDAKFPKIVRRFASKASTGNGPVNTTTVVFGDVFGDIVNASDDELSAIVDASPVDVSAIPDDMMQATARAIMAAITLASDDRPAPKVALQLK